MSGKTALIWNPAAGRANPAKLAHAIKHLSAAGFEVESLVTEKRGDAERFAEEASRNGTEFVIACGGDGTINEVIQPLAFSSVKLGILPLGTVNVLAKELGIPGSFKKALAAFAGGKARKISLGKVTLDESGLTRYFFLMAGVGFDAEVVFSNNDKLKKTAGRFSYLWAALGIYLKMRPDKLRFSIELDKITGFHAVIGKSSRYGGNFKVTRNASLFDPDLHIVIIQSPKKINLLKLAFFTLTGNLPYFEGSEFKVARSIGIEGRARIQVDGDCIGETPCTVESAEQCLAVMI